MARGADASAQNLIERKTPDDQPQHKILSIQAKRQEIPSEHKVVITVERTYSSIGPGVVPPLETTLEAMHKTSQNECPTYRFKE